MVSHSDQIRPQRSTKKRLSSSNVVIAPFSIFKRFQFDGRFLNLFALYHVIRNFTKLLNVCPAADLLWFCLFGSSVSQTPWTFLVPNSICWRNASSNHFYNFSFTDVYVKIRSHFFINDVWTCRKPMIAIALRLFTNVVWLKYVYFLWNKIITHC